LRKLVEDPANDKVPVEALMAQTWAVTREAMKPRLTAAGLEVFNSVTDENDPTLNCQPYGFGREVVNALPIRIRREGANLAIDYEHWMESRTIYMDGRDHPKDLQPTLLGHSIGRYEGDALVVDTVGLAGDIFYPSWSGGAYSDQAHGRERYTIAENPRRLQAEVTIEDPKMLVEPFTFRGVWLFTPDVALVEDPCKDYPTKP
jgi:hypothetical protein